MATCKTVRRNGIVYIQYGHKSKTCLFSTGLKCSEKHWNNGFKKTHPDHFNLNRIVDNRTKEIMSKVAEVMASGTDPTPSAIKESFITHDFWSLFEDFIEDKKRRGRCKRTIVRNYTVYNALKAFRKDTTFNCIGEDYFFDLLDYCRKKDYSDNYLAKLVSILKGFMKWSQKYHSNTAWIDIKFGSKNITPITLSLDELQKIINLDYPPLQETKDMYIFMCATSLSWSEYVRMNDSWIQDGVIVVPGRQKTGTPQIIPLNPYSEAILNKYGSNLPKRSAQVFNRSLKGLCKRAGITQDVTVTLYKGGRAIYETHPKYELITSHTGRKTFATLMLKAGLSVHAVMVMGGWKDHKAMKPYIDLANRDYLKEQMKKFNT